MIKIYLPILRFRAQLTFLNYYKLIGRFGIELKQNTKLSALII